jgi:hypothetical protein
MKYKNVIPIAIDYAVEIWNTEYTFVTDDVHRHAQDFVEKENRICVRFRGQEGKEKEKDYSDERCVNLREVLRLLPTTPKAWTIVRVVVQGHAW